MEADAGGAAGLLERPAAMEQERRSGTEACFMLIVTHPQQADNKRQGADCVHNETL